MKICGSCKTEKDDSEFHKRKASIDGLAAKCKPCQKEYDKARDNLPHRVRARSDYAKTQEGIAAAERARRKWAKENKDKIYETTKRYRAENPKKYRAHGIVSYNVSIGRLVRIDCESCGSVKSMAHHDDYDKPLEVRWLCGKCHQAWHAENGEGANAH